MQQGSSWPTQEQALLLKAALHHDQKGKNAWNRWRNLTDFEQIDSPSYKLLGLVAKNPLLQSLEDPIFEKCRGIYHQTATSNQLAWKKISPFLTQLNRPIVLLKGMALLLHYYRDFGVRSIREVDILVKREDVKAVFSFLYANEWKSTQSRIDINDEEHLKRWHGLNLIHPAGLCLNVQWSFIYENSPLLDASVLHHAHPGESSPFLIPDPTALLLQSCIQATRYSPVPLIRWIADAIILIQQGNIDWKRLNLLASHAHVCLPLHKALSYLQEEFEALIPEESLQKLERTPPLSLEEKEYESNQKGQFLLASWYRYCLNRNLTNAIGQITHFIPYLQVTARLHSPLFLPFYLLYWVAREAYRSFRIFLRT